MSLSVHPNVTFILLSYRQEGTVRAAVEGALAQDHPAMDILLSDDCSPDGTFAAMQEVVSDYSGPHRITLRRNERNLGLAAHLRAVFAEARGELLVLAAGDDISAPQRTRMLVKAWVDAGCGPAMLYSDYRALSLTGEVLAERSPVIRRTPPTLDEIAHGNVDVHGATSAITRSLIDEFPPIDSDVTHEDRVFPFRALLLGGQVIYVDEALVDYRVHGGISRSPLEEDAIARFRIDSERRQTADARQRLSDLTAAGRSDEGIGAACRLTIQDHQNKVALGEAHSAGLEAVLVKTLLRGGRKGVAMRAYARRRLNMLTSARRHFQRLVRFS